MARLPQPSPYQLITGVVSPADLDTLVDELADELADKLAEIAANRPYVVIDVKKGILLCPFCLETEKYDPQWGGGYLWLADPEDGFTTDPMLWCGHCLARAVIDESAFSSYIKESDGIRGISGESKEKPKDVYRLPLLFIERFSDKNMSRVESDRKLTDDQVGRFIAEESFPLAIDGVRLTLRDDNGLSASAWCRTNMNISVPVNSYNLREPEREYPAGISFRHDGAATFLQVVLLNGSTKNCLMSGERDDSDSATDDEILKKMS